MAIFKIQEDDDVISFLIKSMGKEQAYKVLAMVSGDIGKDKAIGFEKPNKQAALVYKFGHETDGGLIAVLGDTKEEILLAWTHMRGVNNLQTLEWNQVD